MYDTAAEASILLSLCTLRRRFSTEQTTRWKIQLQGTIARWFDHRGFGFIDVEDQPNDIFVHISDVKGFARARKNER